jgi:hypothetical protein
LWAGQQALRCRNCGWTYYQPVETGEDNPWTGEPVTLEPHREDTVELLSSGVQRDEEYWRAWWIVQGPCSDREALYAADCPSAHSSGPGREYAHGPCIRRNRAGTRVLVTQAGGLDI